MNSCPLWLYPPFYTSQMDPDEEAEWAEHDRRCNHTNTLYGGPTPCSPDWQDYSPARRVGASPSASGLLLTPLGSPDASPRKEAA